MRRPLGCLTFSALFATVLVVGGIAAAAATTGNGIFSPGQLAGAARGGPLGGVASHAELAGRCDACHTAFWSGERMADRCLACHGQVRDEIATGGGLHGRLAIGAECRPCHTDHRGTTASLTVADPGTFPHERTGFVLRAHTPSGASATVTCRDCHPGTPLTYVPPACITCHQSRDAAFMSLHQQTFGTACLNCHDGVDTYGRAFNHVTYPLTGGHDGAPCEGCHQGATTLSTLKGTSTACVTCHVTKDIHAGRLGTSCADCHSPAAWTGATIDHDRTRYPLVGKHVGVSCASCHVGGQWTGIGRTCATCHAKDNPHGSRFPGDCATCHSPTGWSDVTFSHAQVGFALTGAHATVACAACHPNGRLAGTPTTCAACHAAPASHAVGFGSACGSCHKTAAWTPAAFNAPHAFPLSHGGARGVCATCHRSSFTTYSCASCHAPANMAAQHSGVSGYSTNCIKCHPRGSGD